MTSKITVFKMNTVVHELKDRMAIVCLNRLQEKTEKIEIFVANSNNLIEKHYRTWIDSFKDFIVGFSDGEYCCDSRDIIIGNHKYTKISIVNSTKKE